VAKVLVENADGTRHEVDFEDAVEAMDDLIREAVLAAPEAVRNEQSFVDSYAKWRAEKFDERFTVG
jgi:hypothetical protein